MITKRIFLASSRELKDEREEFEILINRRNKQLISQGVFLDLVVWEDFLDVVSKTRLQDEYNKSIRECDLFVMLFATKVGPYTQEEFDTAYEQFKATSKPLILVYFKDAKMSIDAAHKKDLMSVLAFQEKLDALGHFYTVYQSTDTLKLHFTQQLEKLSDTGFFRTARTKKSPSS
jgi:TIR domain